jgi:chromosome segregation protein
LHLKSITLKGFKSFPDRTKLEFGSGVSVIVGPNGSGKSNITDAVLWALGEQSALAVRGQTMQDVIFAGADGVRSRNAAEVEVVIDNADGRLRSEFSEISITRRLDRSGDGGYTLNGARCRLVDVIEVLSDSGLGKEMHSVISQGRVEAIIHSKPADRTGLIEEAAGLSKHRKRRRRAELKLERTQDNLDRALDVEREARSRLRPLKRQAEAAELHARLERQSLELRGRLGQDQLRLVREELATAERSAEKARVARDALAQEQDQVAHEREKTERTLADHSREREQLATRLFGARSASERIELRLESVRGIARGLEARIARVRRELETLPGPPSQPASGRLGELERELERLEREREQRLAGELAEVDRERRDGETRADELEGKIETTSAELERLERAATDARERGRAAGERAQAAARRSAELELELGAIGERLRLAGVGAGPSLADRLDVDSGYEAAIAGALGARLRAVLVEDLGEGTRLMERAEADGARALVKGRRRPGRLPAPPTRDAERLLDHVRCEPEARELVELVLADAWIVERVADVPDDFDGIAVTRSGTAYHGAFRDLRRAAAGGGERALADRSRRSELEAELDRVSAEAAQIRTELERCAAAAERAEEDRDRLEDELRSLRRAREEALEQARRSAWLIEQRRERSEGPEDGRRAELAIEIAAERRLGERLEQDRAELAARRRRLEATLERDGELLPVAARLVAALEAALAACRERAEALSRGLEADEAVGEGAAAELRRLAQSEYDLQARLREASELLTQAEVRVAQARDREAIAVSDLDSIARRLGYELAESAEALPDEERADIEVRLERIERRRERLGPVNPLAEQEYKEAIEHVEDLERQREDLESALSELKNLIRETDRRIRESFEETFEAAARNFEDVVQQLFPGGHGKLRLVQPQRPRPVLGGIVEEEAQPVGEEGAAAEAPDEADLESAEGRDQTPGIEIEVTPAGKTTKRLSLLSGGEKSLVALGFLFAVFLARPCPFYILDEVEAALDDINIDRFLGLVSRYADRSQFIVITHQRRTMEAADVLYGVSMGGDGISKVVSRRLAATTEPPEGEERLTQAA